MKVIQPGSMLGVLGGGQLGLMFALAARRMGYLTTIVDPDPNAPAFTVADRKLVGPYMDPGILSELLSSCQAVTTEFENVPSEVLVSLERSMVVRPSSKSVTICQDRILEKSFLKDNGFQTAPFLVIKENDFVSNGQLHPYLPGILKSSREGYDGKGQWSVDTPEDIEKIRSELPRSFILEKKIDLKSEFSVVLVRSHDGSSAIYPVAENIHESGILHISAIPAPLSKDYSEDIKNIALNIAERLDYTGILSVEFFLGQDKRLYVNELAPRPHNSGHYTIDACISSQFDQHVRVLAGLSPARTDLLSPCAMGNILGHLWSGENPPSFQPILEHPLAKLYLYGKKNAHPGRKMGHFTVLGKSASEATLIARSLLSTVSNASMVPSL